MILQRDSVFVGIDRNFIAWFEMEIENLLFVYLFIGILKFGCVGCKE
jgi:hypothetical protein